MSFNVTYLNKKLRSDTSADPNLSHSEGRQLPESVQYLSIKKCAVTTMLKQGVPRLWLGTLKSGLQSWWLPPHQTKGRFTRTPPDKTNYILRLATIAG